MSEVVKQQNFKTEGGKRFFRRDFAFTPSNKPSEWKLRLTNTPGGAPDRRIVGAAVAALGPGFRGQKVQIPSGALPRVKGKVRAAWLKANPNKSRSDLPRVLKSTDNENIPTWETLINDESRAFADADGLQAQDSTDDPATTEPDGDVEPTSQSEANGMTHDEIMKALETELEDESKLDEFVKKAGLEDEGIGAAKNLLRFLTAVKDKVPVDVLAGTAEAAGYELPKEEKIVEKIVEKEVPKKDEKEKVLSEIPEEYKEKLDTLFKEQSDRLAESKKEAEEIKKALEDEKDQRRTEKIEKELSDGYKSLSIAPKGFAPIYKAVEDSLTEDQFKEFVRVLKGANELVSRAADYAAIGVPGSNDAGTGINKIEKQAKELVEKGKYKTFEIAFEALLNENPEVYDEYLAEGSRRN